MENRNLLLAIGLSLVILLVFELFITGPQRDRMQAEQQRQAELQQAQTSGQGQSGQGQTAEPGQAAPTVPGAAPAAPGATVPALGGELGTQLDRKAALGATPRVAIDSPSLAGSISLVGGRVDDLTLKKYRETVDSTSPRIELLEPIGTPRPYYADFGWAGRDIPGGAPGPETLWQAQGGPLSVDQPVTLSWTNPAGLTFERRFEIDRDYLFTVTQKLTNGSDRAVDLAPYGLISRTGTPTIAGFYILHEGLLGVFNETLKEVDYDDLAEKGEEKLSSDGGWLGITDKYWLAALAVPPGTKFDARFVHTAANGLDKYQSDMLQPLRNVAPGASSEAKTFLFAGAKETFLLDRYEEQKGIPRFDLAIDFGWFYFLTKPLFYGLHYIANLTGNFGIGILVITVLIKAAFFPLANKSYASMAKMRKLQPEMLKLRERYGEDKQKLNQEMMALYKREGANPLSGCLPIVVQIPVFFALYKVLFVTIEMRHAPFFGWIQDLSAPDPTSILNLFGLIPWEAPAALAIISLGVWPIIMGITMYCQQLLNPQPPDPVQAKIFAFMPIIFTFLLAKFPAGLVIYWSWNNTLSIAQQYLIMRRAGVPIGRKAQQKT